LDGELMVKGAAFGQTSGTVMRMKDEGTGPVDFQYWVFDYVRGEETATRYDERMRQLEDLPLPSFCVKVLPVLCRNQAELDAFEEKCVQEGYEGAMIRTPDSPYKCGRSTEREGWLLKIKRFVDAEAEIIGFDELQHNENAATENAFGRTERKGGQAGLVAGGTLGALRVRDVKTGVEFGVGSGFDAATRAEIWAHQAEYLGKLIVYKCQPYGVKDKPRFPIFKGFRHPDDM
jgi:DNA ligase-1